MGETSNLAVNPYLYKSLDFSAVDDLVPVALMGSFDAEFLSIPGEVIRATIRNNQKCFVVSDPATGKLTNRFILTANIEAKGLLQNLIVAPAKKRGMFDVTAGGRRLRALNFLLEAGKLAKDHPVACRVLDIDAAEHILSDYLAAHAPYLPQFAP